MKKIGLFFLAFALLSAVYPDSIPAETSKNASPPCKSDCRKAADSGKKQSATKKICSSFAGILTNEIRKTANKTKLDILKGGLKYVNEICDQGGTPDLAKITKGLPEKDKARISQKTNAALFDGAVDLPVKNFGPATTNIAATTGKGGQVADLKTSEPNTPKLNTVSEFSLAKPSASPASMKTAVAATAGAAAAPCPYPGEARVKCCCKDENKCWGMQCYSVHSAHLEKFSLNYTQFQCRNIVVA